MIGLVICSLVFAFSAFVADNTMESSTILAANVGWWWYLITGIIAGLIPLGMMVIGPILAVFGDGKERIGGAAITLVGIIFAVLSTLSSMLYLTATWLVLHAGSADTPFAEWNMKKLVCAGVLVIVALLFGFAAKSGSTYCKNRSSE